MPPGTPLLSELVAACRENAIGILADADLLASQGKWARATALTVLSLEEFAKAWICRAVEIGVASPVTDTSRPGSPIRMCEHLLTDHKSKHRIIDACLRGAAFIPPNFSSIIAEGRRSLLESMPTIELAEAVKVLRGNPIALIEKLPKIMKPETIRGLKEVLKNDPALHKAQIDSLKRSQGWEALKERALYVDSHGESVTSPSEITESDFRQLRTDVESFLATHRSMIADADAGKLDEVKQFLQFFFKVASYPPLKPVLCKRCQDRADKLVKENLKPRHKVPS
jgi:AbiV family abortive infection protein